MLDKPKHAAARQAVWSETVLVKPDDARLLRENAHFERQRNIDQNNVKRLSAEMEAGRFTPGTQIYLCVLPDASQLIVNGNHTLEAIVQSGKTQLLTLTYKAVADIDEAGRIYAVFDIQKIRSWKDSLRASGMDEGFPYAGKVLAALGVIERGFRGDWSVGGVSRLGRIDKLEDYKSAAEIFAACAEGAPYNAIKLCQRAGVMAVALETMRYQPSSAADFWSRTIRDEGLTNGMPEKALLNWLRNKRGAVGQNGQNEHARAAALAWNAAFRGEPRDYIRPNAMASFFLLGTRWVHGVAGA